MKIKGNVMDGEEFIALATKCISNEGSVVENQKLKNMLQEQEYLELFREIETAMHSEKNFTNYPDFNEKEGFQKLTDKIRRFDSEFRIQPKSRKNIFTIPLFYRVAASIAIVIFISSSLLYIFGVFNKNQSNLSWNEKITAMGQKSILTLFDGTKITLNAGTKLKYPNNFGKTSREVYLDGEAYFDVTHNPEKPFIVHTRHLSTKVLGTKFNVKAFPEESEVSVSLVDGKVNVTTDKNAKLLQPGQQLDYDKISGNVTVGHFNYLQAIGWKENILIFNDVEIEKVFVQLERAFGVKFSLEDKDTKNIKIKANFTNESFWTIIKVLKTATNLNYKTESKEGELKRIIFYRSSKRQNF